MTAFKKFRSDQVWFSILLAAFCIDFSLGKDLVRRVKFKKSLEISLLEKQADVFQHNKTVICRAGLAVDDSKLEYTPSRTDPNLCTHLIYGFVNLNESTGELDTSHFTRQLKTGVVNRKRQKYGYQGYFDVETEEESVQVNLLTELAELKEKHPRLKVLLSIGGSLPGDQQEFGIDKILKLAQTENPNLRQAFVDSVVELVAYHGLDGLDIYFSRRQERYPDCNMLLDLFHDLREEFDARGYLLTVAFPPQLTPNITAFAKLLDQMQLMAYDFPETESNVTAHNAPFPDVLAAVNQIRDQDFAPEKVVLGIPVYGREYILGEETGLGKSTGLGAPVNNLKCSCDPVIGGSCYKAFGKIYKDSFGNEDKIGWKMYWDEKAQVPFARDDTHWVSFENPQSVQTKIQLVLEKGLGGIMVSALEADNLHEGQQFALLKKANYELAKNAPSGKYRASSLRLEKGPEDTQFGDATQTQVWVLLQGKSGQKYNFTFFMSPVV